MLIISCGKKRVILIEKAVFNDQPLDTDQFFSITYNLLVTICRNLQIMTGCHEY